MLHSEKRIFVSVGGPAEVNSSGLCSFMPVTPLMKVPMALSRVWVF